MTTLPRIGPLAIDEGGGRVPTPEELTVLPTRGEIPLRLNGVTWPDGAPVVLWLRARSFEQRATAANKAAKYAKDHGYHEDEAWALLAARAFIARPEISDAQLHVLAGLNPRIIDEIVAAGERIEHLDARLIAAALEDLAGVATPPAPEPAVAAGARAADAADGDGGGAPVRGAGKSRSRRAAG